MAEAKAEELENKIGIIAQQDVWANEHFQNGIVIQEHTAK